MDQWISQRQAAERYGVTSQTIRNWMLRHPGRVRIRKVSRFKFYYVSDLDRLEAEMFVMQSN